MKLKAISASNLKGGSFTVELGDATAIIGPNFSGKSRIIQAIVLALKGYIPEVGKLAKATWEMSSGEHLTVTAEFMEPGGPSTLQRVFWLEGTVVKASVSPPNFFDGELENIPLLDAEAYFGMTDSERTNYVFARIKLPDTYTAESIIAECERLSLEEAHSEAVEKAKKTMMKDVRGCFTNGRPIQAALTDAVDGLKTMFTYWNKRQKDTTGAVKTLTELKLREKEISTDSLRQLEKDIAAAQAELDRINQEKGALNQKRDTVERALVNRRRIEGWLADVPFDYQVHISKLEKEKSVAEKKLKTAREAIEGANYDGLCSELDQSQAKLNQLQAEKSAAATTIKETDRALAQLAQATECPHCKSKGKDWKANLELELKERLLAAGKAAGTINQRAAEGTEENRQVAAQLKRYGELQASIRELTLNLSRWKYDIESSKRQQSEESKKRAQWQEDLKALKENGSTKKIDAALNELDQSYLAQNGILAGLRARQRAATQLQQDLKRASQAQLEHLDAAAHVLVIKAIGKLLNQKREDIIAEVFGKLLVTANMVCGDILRTPLALCSGTVGRWEESKFIPHRVFSGTEKALCYIAIAVALSAQAPLRLAILDEFGRLDEDNQSEVLMQLDQCISKGVIDQFIVIGTSLPKQIYADTRKLKVVEVKP